MEKIKLADLDLFTVGNQIQLYGAIYTGLGRIFLLPLPDEDSEELQAVAPEILEMDKGDWEKFLRQSDLLEVTGPNKAILRKSQRQIDQNISWAVYRRDNYSCRYCGRDKVPLTVDHIILWEDGGATTEDNLVACCRRCNKLRGNMEYSDWIISSEYRFVSKTLGVLAAHDNKMLCGKLDTLRALSVVQQRSR